MTLAECQQRITYREFLAWQRYLDEDWNRPSRTDWYLMQIALRLRQAWFKNGGKAQLSEERLRFDTSTPAQRSRAQVSSWMKAKWAAAVGLIRKKRDD